MTEKKKSVPLLIIGALVAIAALIAGGAWYAVSHMSAGAKVAEGFEPGAPVMRRLTAEQYKNVIADIFGADIAIGGRFEPDLREEGLFAVGASHVSVTGAGMEQYDAMSRNIAEQVVDEKHRGLMIPCEPANAAAPDAECARAFFEQTGLLLFRRPLTGEELDAYVGAAGEASKILKNFHQGLALSLGAMLSSPQFLFRIQSFEPVGRGGDAFALDSYSKATQLSFFLWNSTPDVQLLNAARDGELDTPKGRQAQVERMVASPRLEEGVRAFFIDDLRFEEFATLTKDAELFPKFNAEVATAAREQTLKTIVNLLLEEKEDYRKLFTTRKTFLTPQLGAVYQVPIVQDGPNGSPEAWQPYEFGPEDSRGGILTHVSFTGLHSPPGRGSPTIRGKAVREVMLCQKVPAPPADVSFDIVQDTTNPDLKTARERLKAHAEVASCAGCHKLMDPIGLALEHFDGAGEFRIRENGVMIDTSGDLDGTVFDDAVGLGEAISQSKSATSCLVDRLSSYARGRAASRSERVWVNNLEDEFAEDEYRLPALMRQIATSEEFYRVTPPEDAPMTAARQSDVSLAMTEGDNAQ